jgi:folate-binding protein YgfZ
MESLDLHQFHAQRSARFDSVAEHELPLDYGDTAGEYAALTGRAAVLDLSYRGRLCVVGADRERFLHGQVTNDVKSLRVGQGCYAALATAKGRMVSDLNIYRLENELLLDFEAGLTERVRKRLESFIIADDVEVVEVEPLYGLLSVQGPLAEELVRAMSLPIPSAPMSFTSMPDASGNELYVMNQPRLQSNGYDLFVPKAELLSMIERFVQHAPAINGRLCGWQAFEIARVEAGIPRFGADMDESNLPPEAGLEQRAISYSKGCYIGQEVINRIRTYGQVSKALRGLILSGDLADLPAKGDKLFKDAKEVGFITSAVDSFRLKAKIALGYVRREVNSVGTELVLRSGTSQCTARIVELPFVGGNQLRATSQESAS